MRFVVKVFFGVLAVFGLLGQAYADPIVMSAAIQFEVKNADPHISTDWPGGVANRATYDTLIEVKGTPPRLDPGLAESWDASDDSTEFVFHLRKNARFHDGTAVNAEAVKFSFQRMMAMQQGHSWMWADVTDESSVTVVDDYTVKFALNQPMSSFLWTMGSLRIVSPTTIKEHEIDGDWAAAWMIDHTAGSGPYTVKTWRPGELYEFARNEDYWKPFPHENSPDVFRYVVYREPGPALLGLIAGDIAWSSYIGEEEATQLKKSDTADAFFRPATVLSHLFMNTQSDGHIGDVNVRKALAYAFDYSSIPDAIFGMELHNSIIPPLEGAIDLGVQTYDLDLAKAALAQTAWPDGGFELDYMYIGGFPPEEITGLMLIEAAQKLNITINLIATTWTEMVDSCGAVETTPDLIAIYTGASYPDPYPFLFQSYGPTTAYNYNTCSWFFDDRVAELLRAAVSESSLEVRNSLYAEAQQIIWAGRPFIMIGNSAHPEARNLNWETLEATPMYGYIGYIQDYYRTN